MAEHTFLVIDTCGAESSLALFETGASPLLLTATLPARTAASDSLTAVRKLLSEAGWRWNDVSTIAVVNGPGSFTGVRVGVALAMGLAESAGLPLVAVSRLAVLRKDSVAAALDAGRNEFYFADQNEQVLLTEQELLARLPQDGTLTVCEPKLMEKFASVNPVLVQQPQAQDAIPFALAAHEAGLTINASELKAFYLRRPDAELAMLRALAQ